MKSEYVIGGCIVLASLIFSASDLYTLKQDQNVLGTTAGLVRLGQVNSESTMINAKLYNEDGVLFDVEGTPDEIILLVKNKVQTDLNAINKSKGYDKDKMLTFEAATITKGVTLELTSGIFYVSEYQPRGFTLSLEDVTKEYKANELMSGTIPEIEAYKNLVNTKSASLSFM